MKLRLRRIEPKSLALLVAKAYFFLFLIFAIVFGPMVFLAELKNGFGKALASSLGVAIAMIVLYPLMGLIMGWISAWIYNFLARNNKGFQLEFDPIETENIQAPTKE